MPATWSAASNVIGSALANHVLFQFILVSAKISGSKCVKPLGLLGSDFQPRGHGIGGPVDRLRLLIKLHQSQFWFSIV